MITPYSIEAAYCFFHQKLRVYEHSTLDWQRDDIEYAIAAYVDDMNPELYAALGHGNPEFLKDHTVFAAQLAEAVRWLEQSLSHPSA